MTRLEEIRSKVKCARETCQLIGAEAQAGLDDAEWLLARLEKAEAALRLAHAELLGNRSDGTWDDTVAQVAAALDSGDGRGDSK